MEAVKPPFTLQELIQLRELGVDANDVTWSRTTMTSDCHICIRKRQNSGHTKDDEILILSLKGDGRGKNRILFAADSAIVSPPDPSGKQKPRVALKVGSIFLVVNAEEPLPCSPKRQTQPSCTLTDVVFFTWISHNSIAFVTDQAVFHWMVETESSPQKRFTRHDRLAYSEIISYKICPNGDWSALTGILPEEEGICGVTQLYTERQDLSECIAAHVVTFCECLLEGNKTPSTLMCVATRDPDTNIGKVHSIELGPHAEGNLALSNHMDTIKFDDETNKYDFPVSIQVSVEFGLLYVLTKYGQLYLCDMESATCLFSMTVSTSVLFTTALNITSQGVIAICRNGQVLCIDVKPDHLVDHLRDTLHKPNLADRLHKSFHSLSHKPAVNNVSSS